VGAKNEEKYDRPACRLSAPSKSGFSGVRSMNNLDVRPANSYTGAIVLIAMGTFLFNEDFCSMSVALATITRDLRVSPELVPWIISTSSLAFAGFLVLGGRASDNFGRRRFCIIGLVLFGTGLLLFASAVNVWMLLAARALEGLGSAFFIPATFSLMNVLLPEGPVRHRAFAIYNAGGAAALLLGFGGSGMITTLLGWRFVFLANFPLVVIAILLAWRVIPQQEKTNSAPGIDVGGAVLITAAAILALTALSAMGKYGWRSLQGLGLFGGAVLVASVFLLLESRLKNPLVPPSTYRYENFLGVTLATGCNMAMTACSLVLLNLFMQHVLNFTAEMSGFGMLPFAVGTIAASHFIQRGMSKYPMRLTIMLGFAVFSIGHLLLATASAGRGYGLNLVPGVCLAGLGTPCALVLLMALGTANIPRQVQGVASGMMMTIQQVGVALGLSVGITVVNSSIKAGNTVIGAFHHGFLAAATISFIGLLCTLFFTRGLKKTTATSEVASEILL
jgi:MFS family permease